MCNLGFDAYQACIPCVCGGGANEPRVVLVVVVVVVARAAPSPVICGVYNCENRQTVYFGGCLFGARKLSMVACELTMASSRQETENKRHEQH